MRYLLAVISVWLIAIGIHAQFSVPQQPMFDSGETPAILVAWYVSTNGTSTVVDEGNVTSWTNMLGASYPFQRDAFFAGNVTYETGTDPDSLEMTAGAGNLTNSLSISQPFSAIIVCAVSGSGSPFNTFIMMPNGGSPHARTETAGQAHLIADNILVGPYGINWSASTKMLFTCIWQDALPLMRINGVDYIDSSFGSLGTSGMPQWAVGGNGPFGAAYAGLYYEMRIFSGRLTASQIASQEAELISKYGIVSTFGAPLVDWDANNIVANDGDLVSQLPDSSTNQYHLNSSGTAQPYWTNNPALLNNRGYLVFDGTTDYMLTNFTAAAQPLTWYLVCKSFQNATATGKGYFDSATSATSHAFYSLSGSHNIFAGNPNLSLGADPSSAWCVFSVVINGGSSSARRNNVLMNSGSTGSSAASGITIGANALQQGWSPLEITRMLGYRGAHTAGQQTNIVNSLMSFYGL